VNAAIEDVLLEAAADEDEGLDFAAFKMLASLPEGGMVSLDQYDARFGASGAAGGPASAGSGSLDGSMRGQEGARQALHPVRE
jgi:hypothetical protein